MLAIPVDAEELAIAVEAALGCRYRLMPLNLRCTYPIFKGVADGAGPVFVKVGLEEEWRRTANLHRDVGACRLIPRLLNVGPIRYHEYSVMVTEWRDANLVKPEDMTEVQLKSLIDGCVELSRTLQKAKEFSPVMADGQSPESLYERVRGYARRHPITGRVLQPLLSVPAEERTFAGRRLFVVHGDFHSRNFAFVGNALDCVYDFDKMTQGLACGDLVQALVERFGSLSLSTAVRRRLAAATRYVAANSPWPKEEFRIMCNVMRLRYAVRRIEKHPTSAWVAFDIARRDGRICEFLRSCV